jgi:hypothetical protein
MGLSIVGYILLKKKNEKMMNTSTMSVVGVRLVGVALGILGFFVSDAIATYVTDLRPSIFSGSGGNDGDFVPTPAPTDTPMVSSQPPVTVIGDSAALTPLATATLKYEQNEAAWNLWANNLQSMSTQYGDTLLDASQIRENYLSTAPQTVCLHGNGFCADYNFWSECQAWGWNCDSWTYSQEVLDAADQREQDHIDFVVGMVENHLDNEPALVLTEAEAAALSAILAVRAGIIDTAVSSMAIADQL